MLEMQNLLFSGCALSLADVCYNHGDVNHLLFKDAIWPADLDSSIYVQP